MTEGERTLLGRAATGSGKADDIGTGNDESIDIVVVNVRPLESVVHSGKTGELAGGWLVIASVLNGNLTMKGNSLSERNANWFRKGYIHAAWEVLRLAYIMKSNDFVANQLWAREKRQLSKRGANAMGIADILPRGQPSWNIGSPFVSIYIAKRRNQRVIRSV